MAEIQFPIQWKKFIPDAFWHSDRSPDLHTTLIPVSLYIVFYKEDILHFRKFILTLDHYQIRWEFVPYLYGSDSKVMFFSYTRAISCTHARACFPTPGTSAQKDIHHLQKLTFNSMTEIFYTSYYFSCPSLNSLQRSNIFISWTDTQNWTIFSRCSCIGAL